MRRIFASFVVGFFLCAAAIGLTSTAQATDILVIEVAGQANGIVEMTCGITLATTDLISVYGSHANFAFTACGSEVT